ncbi:hypothetical protein [Scytonema sp. UIC 10036]|uniref:hypothetical protein n=1 Tax=Scytonema sp. UIC 10036 TaxID=2304196 RepID=UPI001A9AB0DA|nr:hypothetical protein [Scytonema sp. UIC 10036]
MHHYDYKLDISKKEYGESVYSAEIRTHAVDFREDLDAELIPIQLPELIEK